MKNTLLFCLAIAAAQSTTAQSLSAVDKKIVAAIDAEMPATFGLLKESVNINSGTFNISNSTIGINTASGTSASNGTTTAQGGGSWNSAQGV